MTILAIQKILCKYNFLYHLLDECIDATSRVVSTHISSRCVHCMKYRLLLLMYCFYASHYDDKREGGVVLPTNLKLCEHHTDAESLPGHHTYLF
jgi:hypothetical protein